MRTDFIRRWLLGSATVGEYIMDCWRRVTGWAAGRFRRHDASEFTAREKRDLGRVYHDVLGWRDCPVCGGGDGTDNTCDGCNGFGVIGPVADGEGPED